MNRVIRAAAALLIIASVARTADAPIRLTEAELWHGRALVAKLNQQATLEQLLINQLNTVREDGRRAQQDYAVYQTDVLKAHGGTTTTHRIDLEAGEVIPAAPAPTPAPTGATDSTGGK